MLKNLCGLVLVLALPAAAFAQGGLTLPPSGANQKASVSQWIGPVEVTITYHSPDVTSPSGEDRTGKIWGQLVPYGMANLGFGTCGDQCPWRAGANENTTFTVSHDVLIEGEPLGAGTYGLHMIPSETTWTLVFSNDSTSWGSFFYDASEDALRVEVEPKAHPYTHWLTYEFVDRQPAQATVALAWENLQVPWTIEVPDVTDLYIAAISRELKSSAGFTWTNWQAAAQYAIAAGRPEKALAWAEQAVSNPAVGQESFQTLATLSQAQAANGDAEAGRATLDRALSHPTAQPTQVHFLGRNLITLGEKELAMWVFERNAELHPGQWPVEVGLARGHAALGHFEEALVHAEKALAMAPDDLNRQSVQAMIERLRAGEDLN
jgi:tetratricopeptide (TPR) repeat protein